MTVDRNGLEILSREECMGLVATTAVGRVVLAEGGVPSAFPVNFGLLGDDIVFRTSTGSKLTAAVRHAVVAFEVDDIDYQHQRGWSILVQGWARLLVRPDEIARARDLDLQTWAPGQRWHFVLIRCDVITGRRLLQPAPRRRSPLAAGPGDEAMRTLVPRLTEPGRVAGGPPGERS